MADPTGGPPRGQLRPKLRLVRLLSESPAPRKRRRRGYIFTEAQERWIRTAMRTARPSFGTWIAMADSMGLRKGAVQDAANGRMRVTPEMLIRFAAATGLSVDRLLHPSIETAGQCPTCGAVRGAS